MTDSSDFDNLMTYRDDNTWRVDKKIPIALIVLLICQSIGFIWGAAQFSAEVRTLKVNLTEVKIEVKELNGKFERYQTTFQTRDAAEKTYSKFDVDMRDLTLRMRELERIVYRGTVPSGN